MISSMADARQIDFRKSRRQKTNGVTLDVSRLPPHTLECEQGVLGCCLISPNTCISECVQRLGSDGKDVFYDLRHQTVYETLTAMNEACEPVDLISVQQNLKDRQMLNQIGGITYLSRLEESVPSSSNLDYYLDKVREKYTMRKAIQTCSGIISSLYDYDESAGDVEELMDEYEKQFLAIRQFKNNSGCKPIREIVAEALEDIDATINRKGIIGGLSTGLIDLDRETDGLHTGEFILVAAFPSIGKSSLCMNIVEHVALELNHPVLVFSAEMTAKSLIKRSIASLARVNMREVRDGRITHDEVQRIIAAANRLSAANLHIDDSSDLTIQVVRAKARRMHQKYGIKLIVADYAQMFKSPSAENHTMELDDIGKGFKQMAKELNVPVILLSQLTKDKKFGGISYKGASSLGEDADGCWILKRKPKKKDEEDDPRAPTETVELMLDKQRNEGRGIPIYLTFFKTFTRFESASKVSDEENP